MTEFDRAVDCFLAAFPHWNSMEATKLTKALTRRFNHQLNIDSNYVLHLVAELWEYTNDYCQRRNKTLNMIRPGFVRNAAFGQSRFWAIKGLNISEVLLIDAQATVDRFNLLKESMTSSIKVFQEPFSQESISYFFKQLRRYIDLTPREAALFNTIEEVAEIETNFDELWDEVEIRFFEDGLLEINKINFAQIKSRLMRKVRETESFTRGGLMQFIPRVPEDLKNLIKVLEDFDSSFNSN